MVYIMYIMVARSYHGTRAGKTPSGNYTFFAKKPPKSRTKYVFGYFIPFFDGFGLRNLSRIRDLVNIFLFRQGFVSKLARGEKL